jgi:hypothetical protein
MEKICIPLIALFLFALAFSCLMTVNSVGAQFTPKLAVPEFTVEFVNASYPLTTTNAYTGVSETTRVSNNSIQLTIKNQPYSDINHQKYYNIRVKPHFADNWTEIYPVYDWISASYKEGEYYYGESAQYINNDALAYSSSAGIHVVFPVVPTQLYGATGYDVQRYWTSEESDRDDRYIEFLQAIPENAQLDFQVDAMVGHDSQKWIIEHPFAPNIGGHSAPAIAYDGKSDWSSTQTISISSNPGSPADSQQPTPTPTVPEFPAIALLPVLLALPLIIIVRFKLSPAQKKT